MRVPRRGLPPARTHHAPFGTAAGGLRVSHGAASAGAAGFTLWTPPHGDATSAPSPDRANPIRRREPPFSRGDVRWLLTSRARVESAGT